MQLQQDFCILAQHIDKHSLLRRFAPLHVVCAYKSAIYPFLKVL